MHQTVNFGANANESKKLLGKDSSRTFVFITKTVEDNKNKKLKHINKKGKKMKKLKKKRNVSKTEKPREKKFYLADSFRDLFLNPQNYETSRLVCSGVLDLGRSAKPILVMRLAIAAGGVNTGTGLQELVLLVLVLKYWLAGGRANTG